MKSVFRFIFLVAFFSSLIAISRAATYTIQVSDFQFTQNFDTIQVGDTVKWVWINGVHTTTSNGIPLGAQPWNVELNQFNTSFTYVVKGGGTYNYISVPDAPLMGGSFVVANPLGISNAIMPISNFNVIGNPAQDKIEYSFALSKASAVEISLYNIVGSKVQTFFDGTLAEGFYHQNFSLQQNISPGIYFVAVSVGEATLTRRVVIQ